MPHLIYLGVVEGDVHGRVRGELEHRGLGVDGRSARPGVESRIRQRDVSRRRRIHGGRGVRPRRRVSRAACSASGGGFVEHTVHGFLVIILIRQITSCVTRV